ncbi:viral membrane associated, early morphogenesis protein (Cop-A9L) [Choristoneura rosaceana entomopoxvirus 'L']|uniref:Viral membrane associated, early morphogenesis protein (Cop-A9L) n=2 Tax=Betaentomopoxvirus TaxID=10286 RepID=A0A916P146_CBEPV|nr:viral membrane associated, early morphogenesis protein (Cop-A9L) [Choristoneura biennis entomopoxvirus]YP_008004575.1 viral membrane associated, early morphogenesis protein (Cop-A9L) [Choristoneura rosaceana entomopoxvirus 'L']CCU55771.1 viral membrane associated, early morphogenesis protein (Cop-A9L) [Choristoneura biennis entomopoxvirus]CCU56073.1 viral membrane associated, early morphogenesis protein (Cop-A9L) [Choristoneura rosaceana entomopoxvirus 'L']
MLIFTIVLDILASQCFFASVSYLIEIVKTGIGSYFSNNFSYNSFIYKYYIYIQSLVASVLFLIIGLIVFNIADYVKSKWSK